MKIFIVRNRLLSDIVYHTFQCSVVKEHFSQMIQHDYTEAYFKSEIQSKFRLCKICSQLHLENRKDLEDEIEKARFENEEKERQLLIIEEYNRSIENDHE